MRVKLRNPDWPGLDDHVNRLLYAEGSAALIAGDSDRGLRLLRELLARNRDYPGLLDQLASAYRGWVTRALDLGQFAKGRRIPPRAGSDGAGTPRGERHARPASWHGRPSGSRRARLVRLRRLDCAGRRPAHLARPERGRTSVQAGLPRLCPRSMWLSAACRHPWAPGCESRQTLRVSRLCYRPILESDSDDARKGKPPGQLASALELPGPGPAADAPAEVGSRLVRRLTPGLGGRYRARPHRSNRSRARPSTRRDGPIFSIGWSRPMTRASRSG